MALTKISTGGVKDDAASQAKIADEAVDEARLQVSNAGSNGQFLQKQSGNTGGLTWASANQYTHPNHSGEVTSTADGAQVIADNVVDEANLKVSNTPTNGQLLSAQSGNTGGLTWTDPPASSPQFEATASGAITAGKPVIINSNGTVTQVAESYTAKNPPLLRTAQDMGYSRQMLDTTRAAYDKTNNIVLVVTRGHYPSNELRYIAGTPSATGVTWGVNEHFGSEEQGSMYGVVFDDNVNKFIVFGKDGDGIFCRTFTLTGSNNASQVTIGTRKDFDSHTGGTNSVAGASICWDSTANKAIIAYRDNSDSNKIKACTVTAASDGTITFGTVATITASNHHIWPEMVHVPSVNKTMMVYRQNWSGNYKTKSKFLTVSGTTISASTEVNVEDSTAEAFWVALDENSGRVVFKYLKSESGDKMGVRVGNATSGGNPSWGSFTQIYDQNSGIYNQQTLIYDSVMKQMIVVDRNSGSYNYGRWWKGTVSTTANTFTVTGTSTGYFYGHGNITSTSSDNSVELLPLASFYDTTHNQAHIIYRNGDNSDKGWSSTLSLHETTTNLTSSNFIGLAAATVADTATATIDVTGATNTGVSGLTVGSNYYVLGSGALSTSGSTFAGKAVAANKLIVDYLKPDIGAWEVVSTHVLTGSTSDVGWTGWSSDYAQYKVVFSGCYNSDQNLMRIRFYTDSTSGNTGSLVTTSAYKRTGLKTTYGSTTYTVDAGTSSYFYPQVASFGTETNNGELIFPMKTSGHTGPHQCYGEWLGHADHWSNLTCELDANTTHILTGIHIYFTANNSLTAKAPTSGRVTLLRMKV